MARADIPVDLFNPGQVFACLGFLEAADVLLGDAEGGFDWSNQRNVRFRLCARGEQNPFEAALVFLTETEIRRFAPVGYADPPPKKGKESVAEEHDSEAETELRLSSPAMELSETFPAEKGDQMTLPIRIGGGNFPVIELGHWADGSSRDNFKLYSGNRSAEKIARSMLKGVQTKLSRRQKEPGQLGDFTMSGLAQLWKEDCAKLIEEPLNVLTPMGGSFNFDPRGAWTAIDAGYSPNDQKPKHAVEASPVVEFLAAWGLEHARPEVSADRQVRYAVWGIPLPPMTARPALVGAIRSLPMKHFRFKLDSSGKNKIVTFATEEI